MDNYNTYVQAYPNLSNFGGYCTNSVSQCMLASGINYNGDWNILKKMKITQTLLQMPI